MIIKIRGMKPIIPQAQEIKEVIESMRAIVQFFLCIAYMPPMSEGIQHTINTTRKIHETVMNVSPAP
jgi:hypothetical protein